jgi:hypothetical protein
MRASPLRKSRRDRPNQTWVKTSSPEAKPAKERAMSIDSLAGQSSTAAVRRPLFEVSFSGSGSGGASPASGALSGGDSDPWLQHVVAVSVDLAVAPSVNTVSVILAAGTGNPYFSTDTTAALRAAELSAEVMVSFVIP